MTVAALLVIGFIVIIGGLYYAATRPSIVTSTSSSSTRSSSTTVSSTLASSTTATGAASTSSGVPSAASTVKVSMPSGAGNPSGAPGYAPDKITVIIGVNNTVEWTNNDTAGTGTSHTVTSVSGNGSINSGNMPVGAAYSFTFNTPGTYDYLCTYHSWMTGTVVVVAGSSSSSGSSSTSSSSSSASASSSSTTTTSSSSTSGASLNGIKVSIPSGAGNPSGAPGYAPDKITVIIGVNNTVTWTNNDGTTDHTVTSTSVPIGASKFDSGNMGPGATFSYTFTTPGTYQYDCTYHSWMTGTVVVVAGSSFTSSSSSTTSSASSSSSSTSSSSSSST